jgi:hypothetical protein
MAKAILKFDLNDFDDRMAHLRAVKSLDLSMAIWDILQLRKTMERRYENTDNTNNDVFDGIEAMSVGISEILDEYGIKIDDLVN